MKRTITNHQFEEESASLEKLYTRWEVARLAKVCTRTVARDAKAGKIREIIFNRRRIRYAESDVRAYLAGRCSA